MENKCFWKTLWNKGKDGSCSVEHSEQTEGEQGELAEISPGR